MKIMLSGVLLLFLSLSVVPRRTPPSPRVVLAISTLCLLTVTGIGFYGADLVYKKELPRSEHELLANGRALFTQYCSSCHLSDSTEKKVGVGLKGVLRHPTLPISGQPATDKSIRKLLQMGLQDMPPFPDLKQDEVEALIAYLKTL
jgi:cytochrome c